MQYNGPAVRKTTLQRYMRTVLNSIGITWEQKIYAILKPIVAIFVDDTFNRN